MKKLKIIIYLLFGFLAISFLLILFGVITNGYFIASLHITNGICLIIVYYLRKKEKSCQ